MAISFEVFSGKAEPVDRRDGVVAAAGNRVGLKCPS
jgi:hypothetical protein